MNLAVAILPLVAITSVARAEPSEPEPDPDTAQRLSIIGSIVPVAVMGVGLAMASGTTGDAQNAAYGITAAGAIGGLVTASLGEFYSHRWLTTGMAIRTGGLVVANVGLFLAYNQEIGDCVGECRLRGRSLALVLGGAAMYLGGMALDIVDAPAAARAWQARHELQIAPSPIRSGTQTTLGIGAALRF